MQKSLRWHNALLTGEVASIPEIARNESVTRNYIGELIRFAFLAPDIIEAILQGKVPATLSVAKLRKGFPLDWNQQRQLLGFTS